MLRLLRVILLIAFAGAGAGLAALVLPHRAPPSSVPSLLPQQQAGGEVSSSPVNPAVQQPSSSNPGAVQLSVAAEASTVAADDTESSERSTDQVAGSDSQPRRIKPARRAKPIKRRASRERVVDDASSDVAPLDARDAEALDRENETNEQEAQRVHRARARLVSAGDPWRGPSGPQFSRAAGHADGWPEAPGPERRIALARKSARRTTTTSPNTATETPANDDAVPMERAPLQPAYTQQTDPSAAETLRLPAEMDATQEKIDQIGEASRRRNEDANKVREQMPRRPGQDGGGSDSTELPAPSDATSEDRENAKPEAPAPTSPPRIEINRGGGPEGIGGENLTINIQGADLRDVLHLLSEQGGRNILASKSVDGTVSANLQNVDVDTALDAILNSTGFVARREGEFVYVGTPQDFDDVDRALDTIGTRIYRPNYTTALDLQTLITPMLTPELGKASVTAPSLVGIKADPNTAGGDSYAQGPAVAVRDYETVLLQVDQIVADIDRRPSQVAIEAMILNVRLNDQYKWGIDWQMLRDQQHVRFGLGSPRTAPLNGTGQADAATGATIGEYQMDGGLNFAFLDSSLGSFVTFLETLGDTNVIATPRLLCLNRQKAEILIGSQLGYVNTTITETSSSQNVQFLEVGTQLRLRPFISPDGTIRLEIHPELSTGQVNVRGGFTLPDKEVTQVTTNILTRDGRTIIIGGLMREDLSTSATQLPFLGDLPGIGGLFKQKTDTLQRSETLILITPTIVEDCELAVEGERGASDFHRREGVVADKMSPLGKRRLGRKYFRSAQLAWARGDAKRARSLADWAIQFDPQNRAAISLRDDIGQGRHDGKHSGGAVPPQQPLPDGVPAIEREEWVFDALEQTALDELNNPHPREPGVPGRHRSIKRPSRFEPLNPATTVIEAE